MKKFSNFKIVQLALLVVLTLISFYLLIQPEVKQYVFASTEATILFAIIWILLIASFIFLLIDFNLISSIKLNYHNLYDVAYSDQLSGIPNRFSCDTVIEKYHDKKLPEDLSCVMIVLSNLPEVNSLYGHTTGNKVLKDFSTILSSASLSLCFVGRNGGNKFLAIFEHGNQQMIDTFLARIEDRVSQHNQSSTAISIEYHTGVAVNSEEHMDQITQLISLADKRIFVSKSKEEDSI